MDSVLEIEKLQRRVDSLEDFKNEIKDDFQTIMHEVKQARQDSKNATIAVSEVSGKLDELLPHILPNSNIGNLGLFQRLRTAEDKIDAIDVVIKIFKAQVAIVSFACGIIGSFLMTLFLSFLHK